jgi:hypothetical protein
MLRTKLTTTISTLALFIASATILAAPAGATTPGIYYENNVVTIGQASLNGLTINGDFLGWEAGQQPGPPFTQSVAVDANYVYWTDTQNGTIGRTDSTGSVAANDNFIVFGTALTSSLCLGGLTVNASYIYFSNTCNNSIGRVRVDGSHVDAQFIPNTAVSPNFAEVPEGVAVDTSYIYWSGNSGIGRAALNGSHVTKQFIRNAHPFCGINANPLNSVAVDSRYVYWTDDCSHTIGRARVNGSGVNNSFIHDGASCVNGAKLSVAVDPNYIYWADTCNGIGRANLNGSGVNANFLPASNGEEGGVGWVAPQGGIAVWNPTSNPAPPPPPVTTGAAPKNRALPTIKGKAKNKSKLVANKGKWAGTAPISYKYQWEVCNTKAKKCKALRGAVRSVLKLVPKDVGHRLKVSVTATNAAGRASVTSKPTPVIKK